MANNYLQFSTELALNNDEEKEWMKRYLPLFDGECEGAPELLKSLAREAELAGTPEGYLAIKRLVTDECCTSWQLDKDDRVWFYAEECGEPKMILALVHVFLARFNRDDTFTLTWASYCSKLRLDEFGGGAGYATKKNFDLRCGDWWIQNAVSQGAERCEHGMFFSGAGACPQCGQ